MQIDKKESDKAFNDIANAIFRLRVAFMRNGLNPPKSIELGDFEDSDKFRRLMLMQSDMVLMQARQPPEGNPEWICNIAGVEIRMLGRWRMQERGGRDFV